jgi:AraC-like DNA-binding protein
VSSRREDLSNQLGQGFTEYIGIRPGLELILTRYRLARELCLNVEVDSPMFSIGCVVSGKMSISGPSHFPDTILRDGDGVNMWAYGGSYSFRASRGNYHSLSLELSHSFLAQTIADAGVGDIALLDELSAGSSSGAYLNPKPLSSVGRCAALGLLASSPSDPFRSLLLESHALTVLREQLLRVTVGPRERSKVSSVNPRKDAEGLEEARTLLEESPELSPKLSELAAKVGLNEWALKKGFRNRFGVTVYDYLRAHRMKVADAMLSSGDYNVSETAFAVGYKSPGRFAMAFRREFGVAPKTRQTSFRGTLSTL